MSEILAQWSRPGTEEWAQVKYCHNFHEQLNAISNMPSRWFYFVYIIVLHRLWSHKAEILIMRHLKALRGWFASLLTSLKLGGSMWCYSRASSLGPWGTRGRQCCPVPPLPPHAWGSEPVNRHCGRDTAKLNVTGVDGSSAAWL